MRTLLFSTIVLLATAGLARAVDQEAAQKLYEQVTPSLVGVQYTYDGEYGRREIVGAGVVVGEEGLVVTSITLFPMSMPDDQMKEFKIIVPGDDEKELDAVFVGRDERTDLAFVRTKEKQKWPAVKFEEAPVKVGQTVASVGLLGKDAGYKANYAEAFVTATLRGPVPQVLVSPGGLAAVAAPVYIDGKAIGLVLGQPGQSVLLSGGGESRNSMQAVGSPPRLFVPARDFLSSIAKPPAEGKTLQLPWIGAPLSGLKKEVAERFNVKGQPVVLVGDVIAKSPAEKGGLKPGDMITKLNGEVLERGDEPAEAPQILMRKIRRMNVGDKVKFSVLRGMGQPAADVTVTLEEQPKQAHQVQRYLAEDLGFSVREIVFADTYSKKLPAEQPGVSVAFVRPNGPAATAKLTLSDLITKVNSTPVKDLEQFKKLYQQSREGERAKEALVLEVVRERGNTQVIRIEPPQ